jgi:ABC-2 type transport system permease protein
MATTSAAMPPAVRGADASVLPRAAGRAGFTGALRSEFTKIRSVRSTYWTLLALVVACVGIGALFSLGQASHVHQFAGTRASASVMADARAHAVATSLFGLLIGQLIIVVLGALTITSEYSTQMIRTSLTTLPRRGTVFAAKASVFGAVALATGLITSFGSFFAGQAILSAQHVNAALSQPGVLRAVIGGGLFLAACGLLSFGLGAILRHTAGAITTSVGLLFVLLILSGFLPGNWQVHVDKWIPFNAGAAIWERFTGTDMFQPWTGFAVFCGYAAITIIGGLVLFRRRDA